jgi:hypothetical protein
MWKIIKGYNNYILSSDGLVFNLKKLKVEKQYINCDGYIHLKMYNNYGEGKNIRLHRILALAFIDNQYNKPCVDHIDNIRINNNLTNLRWCTIKENNRNRSINKRSTTNVKGVSYDISNNKYRARIMIDGKQIHLGYFMTLEEAKLVRTKHSKEEFGEFVNKCESISG